MRYLNFQKKAQSVTLVGRRSDNGLKLQLKLDVRESLQTARVVVSEII